MIFDEKVEIKRDRLRNECILNWKVYNKLFDLKGKRKSHKNEHEINKRADQSIRNILRLRVKAQLLF